MTRQDGGRNRASELSVRSGLRLVTVALGIILILWGGAVVLTHYTHGLNILFAPKDLPITFQAVIFGIGLLSVVNGLFVVSHTYEQINQ